MICGAADGELAALLVMGADLTSGPAAPAAHPGAVASAGECLACGRRCAGEPRLFDRKSDDFPSQSLLTPGPDGRPSSPTHRRPRAQDTLSADANAPVCAAGATTPEPDPGVEGREEGLDLPGGQIGVRLLCVEGESVLEDGERGWIRPEGESA